MSRKKVMSTLALSTILSFNIANPTFSNASNVGEEIDCSDEIIIQPRTQHLGQSISIGGPTYQHPIYTSKVEPYYKLYFKNDTSNNVEMYLMLGTNVKRNVVIRPGQSKSLYGDFRATNSNFNGQTYTYRVTNHSGNPLKGHVGFRTESVVIRD